MICTPHLTRFARQALASCGLFLLACGGDDDAAPSDPAGHDASTMTSMSNDFCGEWTSLASDVGCDRKPECAALKAGCEALAHGWIACVKTDLSQCLCEPDGDLNCEGSFKPNEGPAQCTSEYMKLSDCLGK